MLKTTEEAEGTVYFIVEPPRRLGNVKVGWTAGDPRVRLGRLQMGNPRKLEIVAEIPGTPKDERLAHQMLELCRGNGEWFSYLDVTALETAANGGANLRQIVLAALQKVDGG